MNEDLDDSVDTELDQDDELNKEQDAFSAAFNGEEVELDEYVVDDDDENQDESEEAGEELAVKDEEEEQPAVDLATELAAELAAEKELSQKLADRVRNIEGRYGSMNAQIKALSEIKEQTKGYRTPSKEEIAEAVKSVDMLDDLKEKFPEWGQEVEEREALTLSRLGISEFASKEEVAELLQKGSEGYVSKEDISVILERERELMRLEFKHPDWEEKRDSDGFKGWVEKQDESVLTLMKSTKSADAIKLLDMYNSHVESSKNEGVNVCRLEKAIPATSNSRTKRPEAELTEQEAFRAAYNS